MQPADVILIAFLFLQSVHDIQKREIEPVSAALTAETGVVYILEGCRSDGLFSVMAAMIPGILVLALALISRGGLGLGDAWIVLIMGLFLKTEKLMMILILSSFGSFLYAAGMSLHHKKTAGDEMPFIPFVLAGYILKLCLSVL